MMPTYEYACGVCGHREDQVRPVVQRDELRRCPVCSVTPRKVVVGEKLDLQEGDFQHTGEDGRVRLVGALRRDVVASMQPHTDRGYDQPIYSDALGVHPDQIADQKRRFPHHNFTPDGRMIFSSHTERKQVLRDLGFIDKN